MTFEERVIERFKENGISISDHQLWQFSKYYEILMETNKVMNLTAITDPDQVIEKHYIDSISCDRIMDMGKVGTCIDIGTGAGFPGIPLKIMYPHISFVLIDSLKKRIRFLEQVKDLLKLNDIDMYHGRAETLARDKKLRDHFDLCVSRAVANLSTLSEYCIPFVREGGYFISYKSTKGLEEADQSKRCFKELNCQIEHIEYIRYNDELNRMLIKIRKDRKTPAKYPRREGIPSRDPL